jgi:hypothetical protein
MFKKRSLTMKSKIWHVTSRDAYNDCTELWTADEQKAKEEFAKVLENDNLNLVKGGFTMNFFCYVDDFEVYDDPNGLAAFNKKFGTDCKNWKEAAIVAGRFIGEDGCVSSEAHIEAMDGEVLPNGKAVVYQVVELK